MRWLLGALIFLSLRIQAEEPRFLGLSRKCEVTETASLDTSPQSPPLDVDDPGTPGCNKWEINITFDGDFVREQSTYELPLFDANYGIGDNLQFKFEIPFVMTSAPESALGDTQIGLKYRFYESETVDLAVYPQILFGTPWAESVDRGVATPGQVLTLPFLMGARVGKTKLGEIRVTADLGYSFSNKPDQKDYLSAAFGVGLPISQRFALLTEIVTQQATLNDSEGTRGQLVKLDVGTLGNLTRHLLVYGSIGHSLISSDDQPHIYILSGIRILTE